MGVFERSKFQKQALNIIIWSLALGFGWLALLLILKSTQLASIKTEISSNVEIGPLKLIQIHKVPMPTSGFQATIKILPGLVIYFALWVLNATLAIYVKFNKNKEAILGGS